MARRWIWPTLILSAAAAAAPSTAFGPGEQASYKVKYLGVTAGTALITVGAPSAQRGQSVWPIVVDARSAPAMLIFPVRDRFVTYWNANDHQTIGSDLFADEGRKRRRQHIEINQRTGTAKVLKQKEGEAPSESTETVTPGTEDIAAATFALRDQPLEVGRSLKVPVFTGAKHFMLTARVEGRESVQTPMGPREVFRIRARTEFSGSFQSKRDLMAYLSTDPSHVPIKVEAEFFAGTLSAELTEYKPGNVPSANPETSTPR